MILLYELTFLPTGILSLTLWVIGSQFSFFFPFFFLLLIFFFLLSSNVCFTIVCWPPDLLSVLLISCFLPSFSFLYHRHPYSCILFLTTCCFLLLFSFILCNFLLTLCREESFYCTVPITPVKREVEELDTIEEVSRVARLDVHSPPCHFWVLLRKYEDFAVQKPPTSCGLNIKVAVNFQTLSTITFLTVRIS